ncbi:hypothetical protein B0H11DRAFT_1903733 [Mycena galericulata]|nr:hypothetical protein B0H11DRAFT_1903733 [Mycena galericulata]
MSTRSVTSGAPIAPVTAPPIAVLAAPVPSPSDPSPIANLSVPAPSLNPGSNPRSQATKDQQAEATRFKKEFIATSTQRIEDAVSFDDLAGVFGDVLKWTEGSKAISVEFGKVLRAIQERLVNHLTILSTPAVGLPGIETTFRAVRRPAQGHSFPV